MPDTPFGMPTYIRVGKKKTPKLLGAPGTVRPPTEATVSGNTVRTFGTFREESSTTSHDVTIPTGIEVGDILILFAGFNTTDDVSETITGWTFITELQSFVDTATMAVAYYRIADGTETDFSFSTSIARESAGIIVAVPPPPSGSASIDTAWNLNTGSTAVAFANVAPTNGNIEHVILGFSTARESTGNFDITDFGDQTEITQIHGGSGELYVAAGEKTEVVTNDTASISDWTADLTGNGQALTVTINSGAAAPVASGDHTHEEADITDLPGHAHVEADITNLSHTTTVAKAGTEIGTRGRINFIEGTDISLTVTDDSGSDEVDVTITSTASGGGGGTLPGWLNNFVGTTDSDSIYWDGNDVSSMTQVTITGSETLTEGDNLLSVDFQSQSSNDLNGLFLARTFSVGDQYQVPVRLVTRTNNVAQVFGLAFTDGTTGASNVMSNTLQMNGPLRVGRYGTLTNASGASFLSISGPTNSFFGFFYLRLTYQATDTFRVESSSDGVTWDQYVTDISKTMTPTHVGVVWSTLGTSAADSVVTFGPLIKTA